ncbi:hypothetical protein TNCV_2760531 [Trichonephila clavipes]|nr:hypothetical protein TNCV_2760531 [Trichonephila clavipes]
MCYASVRDVTVRSVTAMRTICLSSREVLHLPPTNLGRVDEDMASPGGKPLQWCPTRMMKISCIFSPSDNSTRITLFGTFRFIPEKKTPPFLWCLRLLFSALSALSSCMHSKGSTGLDTGRKGQSLQDGC